VDISPLITNQSDGLDYPYLMVIRNGSKQTNGCKTQYLQANLAINEG
jgi:hypothetical protein